MMSKLLLTTLAFLWINSNSSRATDAFHEQSFGEKVVDQAIAIVAAFSKEAQLPDISVFLKRIAKVESNWGKDPKTFRPNYHGGIWQVDRIGFNETKNTASHPRLKRILTAVQRIQILPDAAPIEWNSTAWEKCRIPVFSCLAARIYLATIAAPIPPSLIEQASYWKKHYNTEAGSGTEIDFISANILT